MSPPVPAPFVRRAFRRSRLRVEGTLGLEVLGEASVHDLARLLGCEARNVEGALVGDGRRYRAAESLARLGLVRSRVVRGVRLFALSEAGRAAASELRARGVRPPASEATLRVP
ncbi:MAG TPA: archaellum operon transcriptional activator EarA family protein [Candidatus Thermoplasmatota archaeon]|nr:archaellum operon transcriptional activator EarA family protein [Candidatus Thermoplasmatota archaeon]